MIRSLFILSIKGDVIIEKHWRGFVNRTVLDYFTEELNRNTSSNIIELSPIISTPKFFLIHIQCNDLFFVSPVQFDVPPLLVLEFLNRIIDVFKDYFKDVSEDVLKNNFVTVYCLLDEMMAGGIPFTTEPNILKELIKPPSLMDLVPGGTSISCTLPDSTLTNIPWRRLNVKYATNEIYFDIIEEMDAIFDSNGMLVKSIVAGEIYVQSHLSGVPDMTLRWSNPRLIDDVSFHPCVRYNRWERERVISFVPPDGDFKLMTYRVNQQLQAPIYCKPQLTFHDGAGKFSVMVGTKNTGGKQVEDVVITIPFPSTVMSVTFDAPFGTVTYDDLTKVAKWDIGKMPKEKSPILNGTVILTIGADSPSCHPTVLVDFKVNMFAVSGLKVDSLALHNEPYKPYKGVRSITKAGKFQVRT